MTNFKWVVCFSNCQYSQINIPAHNSSYTVNFELSISLKIKCFPHWFVNSSLFITNSKRSVKSVHNFVFNFQINYKTRCITSIYSLLNQILYIQCTCTYFTIHVQYSVYIMPGNVITLICVTIILCTSCSTENILFYAVSCAFKEY